MRNSTRSGCVEEFDQAFMGLVSPTVEVLPIGLFHRTLVLGRKNTQANLERGATKVSIPFHLVPGNGHQLESTVRTLNGPIPDFTPRRDIVTPTLGPWDEREEFFLQTKTLHRLWISEILHSLRSCALNEPDPRKILLHPLQIPPPNLS